MQRGPPPGPGFSQRESAFRKIESGEILAAAQLCALRTPVQSARDHQVEHQPEIALNSDGNTFADAAQFTNSAAFDIGDRRFNGLKQEWAGKPYMLERLTDDTGFECVDVGDDVR